MLTSLRNKSAVAGLAIVPMTLMALAGAAFAEDSASTAAVVAGATTLKTEMLAIGTAVLPFAAAVLALSLGWRFAKKFLRG